MSAVRLAPSPNLKLAGLGTAPVWRRTSLMVAP